MIVKTMKLRAAAKFQAKNDIRYYLNGIRLSGNYIEATNGHVAVRMKNCDSFGDDDFIVKFVGAIPKKAHTTEFIKEQNVCKHYDGDENLIGAQAFVIVDGKFPDLARVIPKEASIGVMPLFQTKYLSLMDKAFNQFSNRFCSVRFVHSDEQKKAMFEINDNLLNEEFGCPVIVIMGAKDSNDD